MEKEQMEQGKWAEEGLENWKNEVREWEGSCWRSKRSITRGLTGIVHYFTMSILKELAVNGHTTLKYI